MLHRSAILLSFITLVIAATGWADEPEKYEKLARHYAPVIYQATTSKDVKDPRVDYIISADFDGDWDMANNRENFWSNKGSMKAYVYYAVLETATHYFIPYMFYHAMDVKIYPLMGNRGHGHDTEGIILTIRKDGTEYGRVELVQVSCHSYIVDYGVTEEMNNAIIKRGEHWKLNLHQWLEPRTWYNHDRQKPLLFENGSHVAIFINSGSHASYKRAKIEDDTEFIPGKSGIVYRYNGKAEAPSGSGDLDVGYDLISFTAKNSLWSERVRKEKEVREKIYNTRGKYRLHVNRKLKTYSLNLPTLFASQDNKGTPFWAWSERRGTSYRDAGDPALYTPMFYPLVRNGGWSETYIYHPFFGIF